MSPKLSLTPLASLRLSTHNIPSHQLLPNNPPPAHPLFVYHSAFPSSTPPSSIENHVPQNDLYPQWRYTMYSQSHYHSTTHEFLAVFSGRARLLFGGEQNPGKVEIEVGAGDAILVPAGVSHRLTENLESGFQMVGSYPKGCSWDMCYGKAGEEQKAQAVKDVKWLEKDPLYGTDGPATWDEERLKQHQKGKKSEKEEL
ncbi:hypothetical protein K491DRAFT_611615 [Lophiostoma macrostomum CBS 122681]|uniref:Cupin type-2 domain-containing protein n=1 Tax=Lophiostoma macrostomum CBS 122681 TaxID=1314788 RepID=A0A6A6SRN6_9PLEO|nr:hypothetical protein K491DRAFT_611615 [Lophiostoma macrostomum CBS 122681]